MSVWGSATQLQTGVHLEQLRAVPRKVEVFSCLCPNKLSLPKDWFYLEAKAVGGLCLPACLPGLWLSLGRGVQPPASRLEPCRFPRPVVLRPEYHLIWAQEALF